MLRAPESRPVKRESVPDARLEERPRESSEPRSRMVSPLALPARPRIERSWLKDLPTDRTRAESKARRASWDSRPPRSILGAMPGWRSPIWI